MRTIGKKKRQAVLAELVDAKRDLVAVAAAHGLTFEQLAELGASEELRRQLASLCALGDAQAQLMISRHKLHAALRLIGLSQQDEAAELARKASVDLLRVAAWDPDSATGGGEKRRAKEEMVDEESVYPPFVD